MNFSNSPAYGVGPSIPAEAFPLFVIAVTIFILLASYGARYWLHMRQHLIPPPECFWIRKKLKLDRD